MIASFKKFFLDEAEIYSIIKFYFEIYSLYLYRILYIFLQANHCVKSVHIRGYSGSYFPAFGLNTERYGVSFQIQSECWIIQTRKTPNTDTFYAVNDKLVNARQSMLDWVLNTSLYSMWSNFLIKRSLILPHKKWLLYRCQYQGWSN